jgi:TatD DNase family protein
MLIETDSPYLAPIPHRGQRNEPSFVKQVASQIGDLRSLSSEEVGSQTTQNFYNFFGISQENPRRVP